VRWGKSGAEKLVKVFSNCHEVELFVNGISVGVKQRNSTNFPASGLSWSVKLNDGPNTLRAVGRHNGIEVSDEIRLQYQTAVWNKPAKLVLKELAQSNGVATVEARVLDREGVLCLDAANLVRFGLTGDGRLLDNLGTSTGSRVVQLYNGRAQISVNLAGPQAEASVSSDGIETTFLSVKSQAAPGNLVQEVAEASQTTRLSVMQRSNTLPSGDKTKLNLAALDRERILEAAHAALALPLITITKCRAKLSEGGPNDFYSNGDYWWPDPTKPNGLPYIQRDGQTNPENFNRHRSAIRQLRDAVAALGAAYQLTGEDRYAGKAAQLLRVFFDDSATRMNPHLQYAQAVPGRWPGRGAGIIDTLHLIEVPVAVEAMQESRAFPPETRAGLKKWFGDYLEWMITSKNGHDEATAKNNHAVAFWLQVAVFASFTGDEARLAECRRQFREVFVPNQMASDGSFPAELKRTKPYAYSIFQLDNMTTLCQVLTTPADNLWNFELSDGRGIRKAVEYLYPFLADKLKWPLKPDVQAWDGWPTRQPSLLFAGLAFDASRYFDLWQKLPPDPSDDEVQRNIAITQPVLWIR